MNITDLSSFKNATVWAKFDFRAEKFTHLCIFTPTESARPRTLILFHLWYSPFPEKGDSKWASGYKSESRIIRFQRVHLKRDMNFEFLSRCPFQVKIGIGTEIGILNSYHQYLLKMAHLKRDMNFEFLSRCPFQVEMGIEIEIGILNGQG